MGQVSNWGLEIAHMVFDRLMTDNEIAEVVQSQADQQGAALPDREWLNEQITAVRRHPELWHHDPNFWERLGLAFDRFADKGRKFRTSIQNFRNLTTEEKIHQRNQTIRNIILGPKRRKR